MAVNSKLQSGEQIPAFQVKGITGQNVVVGSDQKEPIWLALYRYAGCPMCNLHFREVLERQKLFQKRNAKFIAVFESDIGDFPETLKMKMPDGFSIIADNDKRLYDLFRSESSLAKTLHPQTLMVGIKALANGHTEMRTDGNLTRVPVHFLVLPGGMINTAYYGQSAGDNLPIKKFEEFLVEAEKYAEGIDLEDLEIDEGPRRF